jgi:hypothetical protein
MLLLLTGEPGVVRTSQRAAGSLAMCPSTTTTGWPSSAATLRTRGFF